MTLKSLFRWPKVEVKTGKPRQVLFRAQEIWWASLGPTVGVEIEGKRELYERPVLIFRKFNSDTFWGLPLTSRIEEKSSFQFVFSLHHEQRSAILSQMRVLSSTRLIRKLGKISDKQLKALNAAITDFIHETDPLRGPRVPNGNSLKTSIKAKRV